MNHNTWLWRKMTHQLLFRFGFKRENQKWQFFSPPFDYETEKSNNERHTDIHLLWIGMLTNSQIYCGKRGFLAEHHNGFRRRLGILFFPSSVNFFHLSSCSCLLWAHVWWRQMAHSVCVPRIDSGSTATFTRTNCWLEMNKWYSKQCD